MMTGEIWWTKLVNSVRLLDDIKDALLEGRSVILHHDNAIPWQDIMVETLGQQLACMTGDRTFEVHNGTEEYDPGKYLFEHFCSESQRKEYWPRDNSHEKFLANNQDTPLNSRFLCVTGIHPGNAAAWASSIMEYLQYADPEQPHGIFILLMQGGTAQDSERTASLRYEDYVSDYDCMMLCLTLCSSLPCSREEKMYLAEAASRIAGNHVEHAALLVSGGLDLIREPLETVQGICSDYEFKIANLRDIVNRAIWEAQIKLVFPTVENFRRELIDKYQTKLKCYMPHRGSDGKMVHKVNDLEIGELFHLCKTRKSSKIITVTEYTLLEKMREARNQLAHWSALSYEELKELKIL